MTRALAFSLVLLAVLACRSREPVAAVPGPAPLPLRVAFLPIDEVEDLPSRPDRHGDQHVTDMKLVLDPEVVVRALASRLHGKELVEAEAVPDVATALRERFDLVVRCRLSYGPDIWQRLAEDYQWLIDPMSRHRGMSKKDRIYSVDGRLDVDFHDPALLAGADRSVDSERGRVHSIPIYLNELPTSLEDRAGGGLATLARTIILIPAYMELEGDELEARLAKMVPDALAESLADRVRAEDLALLGSSLVPFHLVAGSARVDTGPTGTVVSGLVLLDPGRRVRRLREVQAGTASAHRTGTLRETERGTVFEVRLPPADPGSLVRIELVAGSRVLYRRSFTLAVPASSAEPDAR